MTRPECLENRYVEASYFYRVVSIGVVRGAGAGKAFNFFSISEEIPYINSRLLGEHVGDLLVGNLFQVYN